MAASRWLQGAQRHEVCVSAVESLAITFNQSQQRTDSPAETVLATTASCTGFPGPLVTHVPSNTVTLYNGQLHRLSRTPGHTRTVKHRTSYNGQLHRLSKTPGHTRTFKHCYPLQRPVAPTFPDPWSHTLGPIKQIVTHRHLQTLLALHLPTKELMALYYISDV